MVEFPPVESPLQFAFEAIGPRITETFSLLANETRLAILITLWDAYDPFGKGEISYQDLAERVGSRDPEQFNYHLRKLEDRLIRRTETGYELRNAGIFFVQATITGTGFEDPKMESTMTDYDCPFCSAQTELHFENGWLSNVCTACKAGATEWNNDPDGTISSISLSPVAVTNRSALEVTAVSKFCGQQHLRSFVGGVCPVCSGRVESWLEVCLDHVPEGEGACDNCGSQQAFRSNYRCLVCKDHHMADPGVVASFHPAAISFFYEHGRSYMWDEIDVTSFADVWERPAERELELVSTDPLKTRVHFIIGDNQLYFTLDEYSNVIEVCR